MFPREQLPRALEGFDILQRLGVGGGGEVFLARSPGGRLVAIKTIASGQSKADGNADALAREASVCARLKHACIVQVRAFRQEPGFAALVFEYVPGVALARVLRLYQSRGLRLPDRAAWHIVERVLVALAYAHGFHDEGGQLTPIVHRDVSPSNVLLDWSGGVKIADFGIAKILGATTATRVGIVKGTPGCMAPEQARGEPVDQRADVYAAALLAWRLATGRVPFARHQADEFELLRAMRNPRIKPLGAIRPDLPEAVLDAVACALQPVPADRTITAATFAATIGKHIDVAAGWLELATLLEHGKHALQTSVKRAQRAEGSAVPGDNTIRYEEVALSFDEDVPPDALTVDARALPSDPGGASSRLTTPPSAGVPSGAWSKPDGRDDAGTSAAPPQRRHVPGSAGAWSTPGGRDDDDEELSALPSAEPDEGTSPVPSPGERGLTLAGAAQALVTKDQGARVGVPAIVAIALVLCLVVAMIAAAAR